jgi:hypothetical protein
MLVEMHENQRSVGWPAAAYVCQWQKGTSVEQV